jgi:hypothetical protein
MSFELKRTELKINVYGEDYELRSPTVDEVAELQERIEKLDDDSPLKTLPVMKSYLSSLGLPEKVVSGLEAKHFIQLVSWVNGEESKKN